MAALRRDLRPTGEDLQSPPSRGDDRFSEKVRNLTGSHRRLYNGGFASYNEVTGISALTTLGKERLDRARQVVAALRREGHSRGTAEKEAHEHPEDLIIEEGAESQVSTKSRQRSAKLRQLKIEQLKSQNRGRLLCVVCGFDFGRAYGSRGRDYIEIHHLFPVHLMDVEGSSVAVSKALASVVPLCSNCHRMVHRNRDRILNPAQLARVTKVSYVWK